MLSGKKLRDDLAVSLEDNPVLNNIPPVRVPGDLERWRKADWKTRGKKPNAVRNVTLVHHFDKTSTYEGCIDADGKPLYKHIACAKIPIPVKRRLAEEYIQQGFSVKAICLRWGLAYLTIKTMHKIEQWEAKRKLYRQRLEIVVSTPKEMLSTMVMPSLAGQSCETDDYKRLPTKVQIYLAEGLEQLSVLQDKLMKAVDKNDWDAIPNIEKAINILETVLNRKRIMLGMTANPKKLAQSKHTKAKAKDDGIEDDRPVARMDLSKAVPSS